jgi:glutaredoxin
MKQKVVTLLLVVLIAGLMSMVVIGSQKKEQEAAEQKVAEIKSGEPVYYYGVTCPYCQVVQAWLEENQVLDKVPYTKKEVWNSRQNAAELAKVAASCGINASEIGVPFLFAEEKCLIGAPDIIAYFEAKLAEMGSPVDPAKNPLNQDTQDLDQAEEATNEASN